MRRTLERHSRTVGHARAICLLGAGVRYSLAAAVELPLVAARKEQTDLLRLGVDGSAYFSAAHLYGTFLYGRNSNSFADAQNPGGTDEAASYTGGFAQLDYSIRDPILLSGRLDWVAGPEPGTLSPSRTFVSFSPGLKLWLHPRIRIAFELTFRNRERPTRGVIQVDLAL